MNDAAAVRPADGAYYDMDATAYHAVESMSQSGAKKILRSPQHYRLERDTPSEPTPAMEFGTAVHLGVLELERFATGVICAPKFDMRRSGAKEAKELFDKANAGNIQLNPGDFDRVRRCIDAVREHPAAAYLLQDAKVELSLFWNDGEYHVPCKARFDAYNLDGIIDIKTCRDASPQAFAKDAANFMYHVQAAHYWRAAEACLNASPQFFAFVCVETEPPHCVAAYTIGRASLHAGMRLMDEALARYRDALATGRWDGYPNQIRELELPAWAIKA